jgi:hypothetical protein
VSDLKPNGIITDDHFLLLELKPKGITCGKGYFMMLKVTNQNEDITFMDIHVPKPIAITFFYKRGGI